MKKLVLPVIAIAVLTGCATPPPPPVVDHRGIALEQIRAAEEAAIKAFGERNADLSASFYAPNASMSMTNAPTIHGIADIKATLKEMMADPNFGMTFHTEKIEASHSGELGYTTGTYTMTATDPKSKKIMQETGRYLSVYAWQSDGSWKMVDDISTPEGPMTPVDAKK
jgi:ketosteroid isomerase-like protein